MTEQKSTKRALLSSVLATLLCVAMLIGATFAWFTDTASTAVNKIQSGNLDVQLFYADNATGENATWKEVTANTKLNFLRKQADGSVKQDGDILWEPGCTYSLPALKVVNNGNLALKYKIMITGIDGDAKLNKVIDWTMKLDNTDFTMGSEHSLAAKTAAAVDADIFTVSGTMQTTADNTYQNLSIDGVKITVYATQDTVEYDSNSNQYDKDAEYADVSNETELTAALNAGKSVILKNDIALTKELKINKNAEIHADGGYKLSGYPVTVAADANVLFKGVHFDAPTN